MMKSTLKCLRWACLIMLICLTACSTPQGPNSTNRQTLIQWLEGQDVAVNTIGQTVTIILPSDELFNPNSANINARYRPVLPTVAALLKTYILVAVQVTAYSDLTQPLDIQALTTKQAEVVANILWDNGIDTRLISAVGGGNSQPVVNGGSNSQRSANRRVEISFRYYPRVSYYD